MDQQNHCQAPTADYVTKSACCCSVGKGWGPHCERCPTPGSKAYQDLCPGGTGYKPNEVTVSGNNVSILLVAFIKSSQFSFAI